MNIAPDQTIIRSCFLTFSSEKIVVFKKEIREDGAKSNVVTHAWVQWVVQKKMKAKGRKRALYIVGHVQTDICMTVCFNRLKVKKPMIKWAKQMLNRLKPGYRKQSIIFLWMFIAFFIWQTGHYNFVAIVNDWTQAVLAKTDRALLRVQYHRIVKENCWLLSNSIFIGYNV